MVSEDITLAANKSRLLFFVPVGIVLVLTGIAYATHLEQLKTNGLLYLSSTFVALPLCVIGTISGVLRLLSSKPSLVVTESGITDTSSLFGVGFIGWEEIAGLTSYTIFTQRYVAITPTKTAMQTLLQRQSVLPRAAMLVNMKISPCPINIPQDLLSVPADELLRQIRTRYAATLQRHVIAVHVGS